MKKIWLIGLLILGTQGVFGRVVQMTVWQCTRICCSDGINIYCGNTCDYVTVYMDDGVLWDIGDNYYGGGGGFYWLIANNQNLAPCWTELTTSTRVTSEFDETRPGSTCGFHTGVDIGTAAEGGKIPLYSGTSGTVAEKSYQENGAGFYVKIHNDNGSYTVYSHLDGDKETGIFNNTGNIEVGTRVTVGTRLGTTDNSGNSTGSHLDIKTYIVGNVSVFIASIQFGVALNSSDIHYCSSPVGRTYINSVALMGGADCR